MSSDLQIRRERADHPQVLPLLKALDDYLASLYAPEDNHILGVQALLAPEVTFFVGWLGDEAVACGAVRRMPAEAATDDHAYGEIKRMYVAPHVRGQRYAERMLQALEQSLGDAGITQALLETGKDQHEAVRLYERCGYRQRGAFGDYPDNGLSLFMAKDLQP